MRASGQQLDPAERGCADCCPPCSRRTGSHGGQRLWRVALVDRPTSQARPFIEEGGVGGADQRVQPFDDVLEIGGVDVFGKRTVEGPPRIGQVTKDEPFAAFQTVSAPKVAKLSPLSSISRRTDFGDGSSAIHG